MRLQEQILKNNVFIRDCAQNKITVLGSIVNKIGGGRGALYDRLISTRIFTLIMNSRNYEESGYDLNLNLVIVLYKSCASYPRRSGLVGKK